MLTIKNLTKTISGRTLFQNAEMTINWGERVALVGPNGAGKSTLFRMILGQEDMDEGTIDQDEYAITGFLAQEAGDPADETILEIAMGINPEMQTALKVMRECETKGDQGSEGYGKAHDTFDANNGYQLEPKAKKILGGLGYDEEQMRQPARMFSGGWVMRAHLAKLLVLEPDLLMLDEPTNHLDLLSLLWFERYLHSYPGAILMISHDREFMDSIVETVIDIDQEKLVNYTGNYSSYMDQRTSRYEQSLQTYRNQKKEVERIEEFIERFRSVASKASQVQSRVKQVDKMKAEIVKPRAPRKVFKFNFPEPPRSNQKVVELTNIHQAYGDNKIYTGLDLTIERGERIVLVGPNGAGKSTLLKIIAGIVPIDQGEMKVGYLTKMGYFSQHRIDSLNENNTVLEEVLASNPEFNEEDARGVLGSFLFRRTDVNKRVKILSGGEKSRLNLVKFLVDPPNLLLMDEPTTHLDLMSIDALVTSMKNYTGTLVFISHDVHFIRNLATTTLHVNKGEVNRFTGGYDYYLEKSGLGDDARGAIVGQ